MRKLLWEIASRTPGFRGKFRLCAALARPKGPPGTVVTRNGVSYRLWGHDLNEWYIATQNVHSDQVTVCLDRLSSGVAAPVLWDIGANIGGVTLPFLQRNPSARAVCFEPSPEVAGRLLANLSVNPALAKRCDVVLLPLTDRHGPTAFFVSSETFNSGVGGLGVSHNRAGSPVRTFGLTGNEMLETGGLPPPTVIKLDVEGFELETLKGLAGTLTRMKPAVVFEHSLYRFKERGIGEVDVVVRHLESCGYSVFHLDGVQRVGSADLSGDCDLLALPNSP
jgi:FkbM family methyltransferase